MSRIQTTFTSDDSSVQKAIARMQQSTDKLIAKNRELAAAAKRGGDEAVAAVTEQTQALANLQREMLRLQAREKKRADDNKRQGSEFKSIVADQISSLKGMALGLVSVEAAVNQVRVAYEQWDKVMQQAAEHHRQLTEQGIKGLAEVGQLPRAREWFEAARQQKEATPEQFEEIAKGIRGAGTDLPPSRQRELATAAAPVAATGIPREQFGRTLGELAEIFPKKTADDIAQIAYHMQGQVGFDASALADSGFQRAVKALIDKGVSTEKAISLGLQSLKDDIGPKPLEKLAATLGERIKAPPVPVGRAMTEAEQRHRAFALEKDAARRLEMLEADKGLRQRVLGAEAAQKFDLIDIDAIYRQQEKIRAAQQGTLGHQVQRELAASPQGREMLQRQRIAVEQRQAEERPGMERAEIETARQQLDSVLTKQLTGWGDIGALWKNERTHPIELRLRKLEFGLRSHFQTGQEALRETLRDSLADSEYPVSLDVPGMRALEEWLGKMTGVAPRPRKPARQEEVRRFAEEQKAIREQRGQPVLPLPDEQEIVVPPRPKIELPPAPPPIHRQPAPLGPSLEERRRAFQPGLNIRDEVDKLDLPKPKAVPVGPLQPPRFQLPPPRQPRPQPADQSAAPIKLPTAVELLPPDYPTRVKLTPPVELVPPDMRLAAGPDSLALDVPQLRLPQPTIDVEPAAAVRDRLPQPRDFNRFDVADLGRRMPSYEPESLQDRFPRPMPAPTSVGLQEALAAALGQQATTSRSDPGLASVMSQMLTVLRDIAESTGATKQGVDRLAGGGRAAAGVHPAVAVRHDRNRHYEAV
jgi:hypothetical protein